MVPSVHSRVYPAKTACVVARDYARVQLVIGVVVAPNFVPERHQQAAHRVMGTEHAHPLARAHATPPPPWGTLLVSNATFVVKIMHRGRAR